MMPDVGRPKPGIVRLCAGGVLGGLRLGVRRGMMLGGFFGVMLGLNVMATRQVGVMAGLFVFARFVVLGGVLVVLGSMFVVLRCVAMMFGNFFRHGESSLPSVGVARNELGSQKTI
jgi:hypothetical protein